VRIVLCNGCFDVIHSGHLAHLLEARFFGDRLVVALTIDEKVNKGPNRPIHSWADRAFLLRGFDCVDEVIPTASAVSAIRHVKPAYFVKGIDYAGGNSFTEDIEGACEEVGALLRYTKSPKKSSADIIKKALT